MFEYFRSLFEGNGLNYAPSELSILVKHFCRDVEAISSSDFSVKFRDELAKYEWSFVGKQFLLCVQKAHLNGVDIEELMSNTGGESDEFLSVRNFNLVLETLSKFSTLTLKDMSAIVSFFTRRSSEDRDPISVREVLSFLDRPFVGNIRKRLAKLILFEHSNHGNEPQERSISKILSAFKEEGHSREVVSYEDIEVALENFSVFSYLTHEQVRSVLRKCESETGKQFSIRTFLSYIGVSVSPTPLDAEALLKLLLEKGKDQGIPIEDAFRHYFDIDADGMLTRDELEESFSRLQIFDNIPNWREQIPDIVSRFDKNGDGQIELKEFMEYLGFKDFSPNIVQRLTNICVKSIDRDLPIDQLFDVLDKDRSGKLNGEELKERMTDAKMFSSHELNTKDALTLVHAINGNSSDFISKSDFVSFFTKKVEKCRHDMRIRKLVQRFRYVIKSVLEKGKKQAVTIEDIFKHFDKSGDKVISKSEFESGLKRLPHFKDLSADDVRDLCDAFDCDHNGEISLDERNLSPGTYSADRCALIGSSTLQSEIFSSVSIIPDLYS